jgi:N-acyl-D-aspartate/D-glutamate deacylase
MAAEIVIRGGTVVDGSGAPGRRADVAIEAGRIREIGPELSARGARELDASGCIVAPGFIDIHTHYDAQVFWDPALSPSCFHGVTTVVAGNCGFSIAPTRPEHRETIARTLENVEDMDVAALAAGIPWDFETFPQYLESVRRRGTVLNFNAYIGHTALRLFVMGDAAYERVATPAEVEGMCRVVGEAMAAGSVGFATSFAVTHRGVDGKPIPSRFCERAEFDAIAHAVGRSGRGVVHIAPGDQLSIPQMYELQPQIGRPFTYGALLSFPGNRHRDLIQLNDAGWAKGAQVWPQVSPRALTLTIDFADPFSLNVGKYFAELMSRDESARRAAYADPEWRRKAAEDLDTQVMKPRWDRIEIAESNKFPELVGRRVAEVARERRVSPLDLMCELSLAENLETRFRFFVANDDVEEVDHILTREHVVLGLSDAGAHVGQLCDAPQASDLLGLRVRERGTMPIERAIRKLSGEVADILGLVGRGYLRPGCFADVAVIDPLRVAPGPVRRVRDFPANSERLTADRPPGVRHVLVNGVPIRVDEKQLEAAAVGRPGMIAEIA